MYLTILINGTMGFVFLMVLLYVGGDFTAAIESPTGVPFIGLVLAAFENNGGTIFATLILTYIAIASSVGLCSSTSRTCWAFARDHGTPFSPWLSRVHPKWEVPVNAILVTTGIESLVGIIYFGNETAFNAILSMGTVGLYLTYLIPIGLMLFYARPRITVWGPFRLRKAGMVINALAFAYSLLFFVLLMFPPVTDCNNVV